MAGANLGQEHGQKAQQWLCVGNQWTRNWYLGTQTQPSQYLQDHFSHFGKITTSNTKCVADQWGTATLCSPQSHTLPGAAEAPACSKSNHGTKTELNSRRWVVSPKKLHNKDFLAVTGALPAACTLLSFPRAWQSGEDRIISYSFKSSSTLTFTLANYERLCLCRWMQHGLQCQQEPARGSIWMRKQVQDIESFSKDPMKIEPADLPGWERH